MRLALPLLAALFCWGLRVDAQSAQITAQAGLGPQVQVTGQQNLTFGGGLYPGVARTVNPRTTATAARFLVSGLAAEDVNITFNVPTQLTGPGPGLPIDTWRYCSGITTVQANCVLETTMPFTRTLTPTTPGQLWVWVGATARPTAAQRAGTYTGIIELVAAYVGN